MNKELLENIFQECFPRAKDKDLYINALLEYAPRFEINTDDRWCAFLSQVGHECGGFTLFEESLNYSVDALISIFGRHRISIEDAKKYGRTSSQKADQEALANILYGGKWGAANLGNTQAGDGWKYRGLGPKQLTGRGNITKLTELTKIDFLSNPELLLEPANGIIAALHYWNSINPTGKSLNLIADTHDDTLLTKRVNGGSLGLKERRNLRIRILRIIQESSKT